jgi:hypothetical protein
VDVALAVVVVVESPEMLLPVLLLVCVLVALVVA